MDFNVRSQSIFDSHAHYTDERFDNPEALLSELKSNWGVGGIINCAVDIPSCLACIELSKKFDFCHTAAGFHASDLPEGDIQENISALKTIITENKIVAVGEIGLDYYWDVSFKDKQLLYFEEQVKLANALNLPVIVHDRDAHADTLEILKRHKPRGVVHCFSGSTEMAREIIKLGMYIGIGGVVTFKNAKKVCEVVKDTPMNSILFETDAPYMAPAPIRGTLNHSSNIRLSSEKMAELLGMQHRIFNKITVENAMRLFRAPKFQRENAQQGIY